MFIADDLGAWLIGLLADAGRKKLTSLVLGTDQQRALRQAATGAVQNTVDELRPGNDDQAEHMALVITQVFNETVVSAPLTARVTILEALQTRIVRQLAVLDDANLTGTGQSSAELIGLSGAMVAQKLSGHLLQEILLRGSRGGPLAPLADQLNHDATHLQGLRLEAMFGQLANEIRETLDQIGSGPIQVSVQLPAAAPRALSQLPMAAVGFTGRDNELALLATLLDPAGISETVVVSAVAGLAGVGKTTLAVEAGHAALKQGWFTGGVLFVDLHGYDDVPVGPGQALDTMLRAVGVAVEHIPPTEDERTGLYRSMLAQITEPVLILIDNAPSEEQVRPLLPGDARHKVLVTSRHTLAGLDARLVDVSVLDGETGVELLNRALRAGRPEDTRIVDSPSSSTELAELCGGLPLALRIIAAILKADPSLTIAELASELAIESRRLETLEYEPARLSVAAAFELSYRRLGQVPARMFRLLPLSPGPDISTASAAILAELPDIEARKLLAALAQAHILETAPNATGRWKMHDLLRLYARRLSEENAEEDGSEQAIDRLMDFYLHKSSAADAHLQHVTGLTPSKDFSNRTDALGWLDAERASLVAAVTMASATGRDRIAVQLPISLAAYMHLRRRFDDLVTMLKASLAASRRAGDRHAEAGALNSLGGALQNLRDVPESISFLYQAAAIFRETRDRFHEGAVMVNLGLALQQVGQFDEGIEACKDAITICRETGDRNGEGKALNNLGMVLREIDDLSGSIKAHQAAALIFQETGDREGSSQTLHNLGMSLRRARQLKESISAFEGAIGICQEVGDRHGEAMALNSLGLTLRDQRNFEMAITLHREAITIFQETDDPSSEGDALNYLGISLRELGRSAEAIAAHQDYLKICRQTRDRHGEGMAFNNLGLAFHAAGRYAEASLGHMQASLIYYETADRAGQTRALMFLMRTWLEWQQELRSM